MDKFMPEPTSDVYDALYGRNEENAIKLIKEKFDLDDHATK
jgi:hypothetical protein